MKPQKGCKIVRFPPCMPFSPFLCLYDVLSLQFVLFVVVQVHGLSPFASRYETLSFRGPNVSKAGLPFRASL